jgi:hypothetical protein
MRDAKGVGPCLTDISQKMDILLVKIVWHHLPNSRNVTNLEVARINIDNQEAYNKFVISVSDYTAELKDKKLSGCFVKRVFKKYFKQTKSLAKQINLIDDRLEKIDNKMEEIFIDSGKFENINVDDFFQKHK